MRRLASLVGLLAIATVLIAASFLIGAVYGTYHERQVRFRLEEKIIVPVLPGDPAFKDVVLYMYTADGTAWLDGKVGTEAEYSRLEDRMVHLLGDVIDKGRIRGVSVGERPNRSTR